MKSRVIRGEKQSSCQKKSSLWSGLEGTRGCTWAEALPQRRAGHRFRIPYRRLERSDLSLPHDDQPSRFPISFFICHRRFHELPHTSLVV